MNRKPLTNRLRVLRAERRWTQLDVAKRLGYPTKFRYWQIENDQLTPTPKELRKLARIFEASETEMFPPKVAA